MVDWNLPDRKLDFPPSSSPTCRIERKVMVQSCRWEVVGLWTKAQIEDGPLHFQPESVPWDEGFGFKKPCVSQMERRDLKRSLRTDSRPENFPNSLVDLIIPREEISQSYQSRSDSSDQDQTSQDQYDCHDNLLFVSTELGCSEADMPQERRGFSDHLPVFFVQPDSR